MIVTALNRYAVKGLSGDALTHVELRSAGETFPDDRRFALLQRRHLDEFRRDTEASWLHKEKFLCAFTEPGLLARLRTTYSIRSHDANDEGVSSSSSLRLSRGYPNDAPVASAGAATGSASAPTTTTAGADGGVRRILTVQDRASGVRLLPELDLNRPEDRERLQEFMSAYSGRDVLCVAGGNGDDDHAHSSTHQFGNTSSGYKQRGDTRTVHIVTQQTVDALSRAAHLDAAAAAVRTASSRRPPLPVAAAAAAAATGRSRIRPNRFRPNIVVDGGPNLEPFEEFQWIGRRIKVVKSAGGRSSGEGQLRSGLELSVIAKTVRCRGVSVDPDDDDDDDNDVGSEVTTANAAASFVDVPDLLVRHFPQHGPYLGVYAVVESPGTLSLGDELSVLPLN